MILLELLFLHPVSYPKLGGQHHERHERLHALFICYTVLAVLDITCL